MSQDNKKGFTLVELTIVIVVIGILATIVTVGYGAWRTRAAEAAVKSDLKAVAAAMNSTRNFNNKYPGDIPGSVSEAKNTELSYQWGDDTEFCVEGVSLQQSAVIFNIREDSSLHEGACSAPRPEAPTLASVTVIGMNADLAWSEVSYAETYKARKRIQGDTSWGVVNASSTTSHSFSGLDANKRYEYQVQAENATGSSDWSNTISRVTIEKPKDFQVTKHYCGNDGGLWSWRNGTVTWTTAPSEFAPRYLLYQTQVDNNHVNGGSQTELSRSTRWAPNYPGSGTFSVTGIGPDGERSEPSTWTTPTYPAYEC